MLGFLQLTYSMNESIRESIENLKSLLSNEDCLENSLQELLELKSELIPKSERLNHDIQWNSVISKFQVSREKEVDFAYVTKSTNSWRIVLIELERPNKKLFIENPYPDFHSDTRQAISQIDYWKNTIEADPISVRERLRPLVHMGGHWDTNPIEFYYVLIIGRNIEGHYSRNNAHLISRLRKEKSIHLYTWDSVIRNAETNRCARLNVLSHWKGTFKFKYAQAWTNIFSFYYHDQIILEVDKENYFRSNDYDIDAWRAGKRLLIKHKYPQDRFHEVISK